MALASYALVAGISPFRPMASLMAVGLVLLFILLAVLVWSRFGQARPVAKCVVLSLLAHVLLVIYMYSTHVLYGPPGKWTGQVVKVRLRDTADDVEAGPVAGNDSRPWQQPGFDGVPLLLAASAAKPEESQPEESAKIEEAQPAEAEPEPKLANDGAENDPKPEQPALTDLLDSQPADSAGAKTAATDTQPAESTPTDISPVAPAEQVAAQPTHNDQYLVTQGRGLPRRLGDGAAVPEPLTARVAADRLKSAQPFGATAHSEAAVAAALDWLARVQSADGRWDADQLGAGRETKTLGHDRRGAGAQADTGVTALALLAFLGSGESHLSGPHRESVQHGLEFLLNSQTTDGCLSGQAELFAAMYCHGMATLAIGEAYALTGDERLRAGVERAITYTLLAQSGAGGWRYRPGEPADPGDMSQFGWQVMATKSVEMAGLSLPPSVRAKTVRFLQSCSAGRSGGLASYRPGDRPSRTMTAEALACRYFLDAENAPATLDEAAAFVLEELPSQQSPNYYYWYYGTLAMFQRQGTDWQRWNTAMQAELLNRQRWDGTATGSYDPDDLWGGYGGRVYSTALATLCLEVYYRYLPVHGNRLDDSRLTDRQWQPVMPR